MTFLQSLLLGLIQGLTEFLPISSSAHLVIAQTIFGLNSAGEADLMFSVMVHLGTLAAVMLAFRKTIGRLFREVFRTAGDLCTRKFSWQQAGPTRRMLIFLIVSLLPLFVVYPFSSKLDPFLNSTLVVGICLIFNSFILILSDMAPERMKTAKTMNWKDALFVGVIQCVAILPGISRSGSTITAGLSCGMKRSYAAKYSFILSIPTILGGALLEILDAVKTGIDTSLIPVYLTGMIAAAVSGFFAIKLLQMILKSKRFVWFAVYCFLAGVGTLIWTAIH